jgi:hypothetical protein
VKVNIGSDLLRNLGNSEGDLPPVMSPISKRIVPDSEVHAAPAAAKSATSGSSTYGTSAPESVSAPRKKKAAAATTVADPAAASTRKASGKKASSSTADEEATHPMVARQKASRAGGLRSVAGSGQTGTCVASGNPPKT